MNCIEHFVGIDVFEQFTYQALNKNI